MYTENNTQSQDIVCKVPVTEEEAFKILDEIFPLEEKRMAIEGTKEEFTANEHFELGMWIRNNWIYPPEDADNDTVERYMKCYAMLTGTQPGDPVFEHPDSISGDFLGRYYDHLKDTCRILKPVEPVRRKPVKCPHCGAKVLRIQYGYPGPEMMEAAERGEILLGGCCISPDSPDYACPICGQAFIKTVFYDR